MPFVIFDYEYCCDWDMKISLSIQINACGIVMSYAVTKNPHFPVYGSIFAYKEENPNSATYI